MNPLAAIKSAFGKYITFKGRASRSEFWWFFLVVAIVMCAAIFIEVPKFIQAITPFIQSGMPGAELLLVVFSNLFAFFPLMLGWLALTALPSIAVSVRRLHDSNLSGWFYLVSFIPYVGGVIFLYLVARAPRDDDNRFGPSPFDPSPTDRTEPEKPKVVKGPETATRFARRSKPKASKAKYADMLKQRPSMTPQH